MSDITNFDDVEKFRKSLLQFGEVFAQAFLPIAERLVEAMRVIETELREEYKRVGQPYGPNDEAMCQYFRDVIRLNNLVFDIQQRMERVQMLDKIRHGR